jgi:hypothetical protein
MLVQEGLRMLEAGLGEIKRLLRGFEIAGDGFIDLCHVDGIGPYSGKENHDDQPRHQGNPRFILKMLQIVFHHASSSAFLLLVSNCNFFG